MSTKGFEEACTAFMRPEDIQNMRVFSAWMTATGLSFAATTVLLDGKHAGGSLGWTLVAVVVALLIQTLRTYVRFLHGADELLRKVQLEALATSFAAGTVFMIGYRLSERLGARRLDIDDPLLVMLAAFAVGQWLGWRRYGAGEVES